MFRRALLRATGGLGALAVAGCSGGADGPAFEEGPGGWESGAAIGPEVELGDLEWEVGVSGTEAGSGERSLRIWNEGDHDDGVTWGGCIRSPSNPAGRTKSRSRPSSGANRSLSTPSGMR